MITAEFVGGPLDGQVRDLSIEMDLIEFRPTDRLDLLVRTVQPPRSQMKGRMFYRQSVKTRGVYVYQP